MEEKLNLVQEWDKVFPKSEKVNHSKVTFHNCYGISLAVDMYEPKGARMESMPEDARPHIKVWRAHKSVV